MVVGAVVAVVVVLALLIAPNPAPADADGDPYTGRWLINGTDAQDVGYSGSLIIEGTDEGYDLEWIVTGSILTGSAVPTAQGLEGRWETESGIGPQRSGTVSYVVEGETLIGVTTIDGVAGTGSESGELSG